MFPFNLKATTAVYRYVLCTHNKINKNCITQCGKKTRKTGKLAGFQWKMFNTQSFAVSWIVKNNKI
jgi:hypothetical protein